MKFKTIAIIGLGLMGGSLAAACRRRFPNAKIVGITRDSKAAAQALKKGWIHERAKTLGAGVSKADFIVLCTPVDTFAKMLSAIEFYAQKGALVTDVGSVKGDIAHWVSKKRFRNLQFVGAHPMTGSHERGLSAARADLYQHGFTFVIRSAESGAAFKKVFQFWKKISPKVIAVSASEHDKAVAEISHLPHAVASCVVNSIADTSLKFAAGGFADATRIAQGHPSIWLPIFKANKKSVLAAISKLQGQIKAFKTALAGERDNPLKKMLESAAKKRSEISL